MAFFARKPAEPVKTTPEAILASALTAAWKALTASQSALTLKAPKTDEVPPGTHAVLVFSGSNVPLAAMTSGLFRETGADLAIKLDKFMRAWLAATGLPAGIPASNLTVCTVSLAGPGRETFLWQVMEHKRFDVGGSPGKTDAGLWISAGFKEYLDRRAEGLPETAPARTPPAIPGNFRAERPRDLPVLDAFCPRTFRFENRGFTTAVKGFSVFAAGSGRPLPMEQPVWFKAAFEYTAKTANAVPAAVTLYYAFLKTVPSLPGIAGSLFTETARQFLETAGLQPGRLGLKALEAMPPVLDTAAFLSVDFFVRSSGFSLQAAVFFPAETVPLIAKAGPVPYDIGSEDPARTLFALNAVRLEQSLPALLHSPDLRQKIPKPCVNELFRLLSDTDFALVIQNVLLPAYGAKELPALLFYTMSTAGPDGTEKEIIVPYGPLEGQRLEIFMPEAFREEFFRNTRTLSGNGIEACAALNARAMHDILDAVRSARIDSSPRLAWLMNELIQKEDRAGAEAKLAELKNKGIPFSLLRALHPKEGQRICAALDDRDIALALIDCEAELATLNKIISAAKRQRLAEDVQYYKKLVSKGEMELADAVAAKEKIAATVERETGDDGPA